jgi:hypothetical protein
MSTAPTNDVDLKAIRFHVKAALAAIENDHDGEKLFEVEKNLRTAAALLNNQTN